MNTELNIDVNSKQANSIKNIYKYVMFNLKSVLTSKFNAIAVFSFMIFALIMPLIFFPYKLVGGTMLMIYLSLPIFIILGWLTYSYRNSTLFNNIRISSFSKNSWYIAQLLTVIIIGNFISFFFWMFVISMGEFGWLLSEWIFEGGARIESGTYVFQNYALLYMIYITNVNILVVFGVYFIIKSFASNIKSYFIVVIILMILGIFFTGTLNSYYSGGPNPEGEMEIYANIFPVYLFVPTLFYPLFGVGQFTTSAVTRNGFKEDNGIYNFFIFKFTNETWYWTAILLQPYAYILASAIIGSVFNLNR